MQRSFSIQFVSKVTGINAHTIRAWEKRYQAVVPLRSESGKRIYSQGEVDRLIKLHELVKLGNAISDVAKLGEQELAQLYTDYVGEDKNSASQLVSLESIDIHSTLQNIILALRNYKLDIISYELEKLKTSLTSRDLALSIIIPLLEEVDREVKGGVLNIGQEHSLSSILKFHIGQTLFSSIKENDHGSTIIFATPEGELNEFGIMISALLASFYNIKFYYLGPNMPADSLAQACRQVKAQRLILGVTSKYNQAYSKRLDEFLIKLTSELSDDVEEIIVGGDTGVAPSNSYGSIVQFIPTLQMLDQNLSLNFKKAS
jgi:DNA-binding transcriptional MerR regulator